MRAGLRRVGPKAGWLATAAVLLLLPIFLYPLQLSDEPRVAHTSLQMLQSGNFAVPTVNDEPFLQTPPLCYWLFGAWFRVAGYEPDGIARVVPVVAALGTIILTASLMARYCGAGVAFLSAAILISFFQFWENGHRVVSDMVLTFFILLGFAGFVRMAISERPPWWTGLQIGLGVGAAFLTKGLPGPLFLGLTVVAMLVFHPSLRTRFHARALVVATLVALVIVIPWVLALYRADPSYPSTLLFEHVWMRATKGGLHNPSNWQFFHRALLHMLPWAPLVLFVIGRGIWGLRRWSRRREEILDDSLLLFFLLPFALLLCSRSKRNLYLLPTLPAVAMMLAIWLAPHVARYGLQRGTRIAITILAIAGVGGITAVFAIAPGVESCFAWIVLVVFIYWLVRWWRGRKRHASLGSVALPASVTMALLCIAVCVSAWGAFVFTLRSPRRSGVELGQAVLSIEKQGHEIFGYALAEREVGVTAWYLRHSFGHIRDPQSLVVFLGDERAGPSALVLATSTLASLRAGPVGELLGAWREAAKARVRRGEFSVLVPTTRVDTSTHKDREKRRESVEGRGEIEENGNVKE